MADTAPPQEMTTDHMTRANQLLREVRGSFKPTTPTTEEILAAYNAVLLKDVLFAVNEIMKGNGP